MDLSKIRENGWRQCCFCPEELMRKVAGEKLPGDELIIISQHCDVLCRRIETEPDVEAIWGTYTNDAPNPRTHRSVRLNPDSMEGPKLLLCSVHDRVRFPREYLLEFSPKPDLSLASAERRKLVRMLVKRYDRPAFPDAFGVRLEGAGNSLRKSFQSLANDISAIYMQLTPHDSELESATDYKLHLLITVTVLKYKDPELVERVESNAESLKDLIEEKCQGIELLSVDVVPEDAVSLDHRRKYVAWDWEYLSHGKDDDFAPDLNFS